MSPEQKESLKAAIEKKIEESEQSVKDLREATKPMGLDSSMVVSVAWIISTTKPLMKPNCKKRKAIWWHSGVGYQFMILINLVNAPDGDRR